MFCDVKLMHPHNVFDILFLSLACTIPEVYFDISSEGDVKMVQADPRPNLPGELTLVQRGPNLIGCNLAGSCGVLP